MLEIYLAPLSVNHQSNNVEDAVSRLVDFLKAISYMEPTLSRNARIHFDPAMESRALIASEPLIQTINNIPDHDVRRLWYLYTRNRANSCGEDTQQIMVSSGEYSCEGNVTCDEVKLSATWLGLSDPTMQSSCQLTVNDQVTSYMVAFLSGLEEIKKILPQYEANPKHRGKGYTRAGGVSVSPMTLSSEQAQTALLEAVVGKGGRYSRQRISGKFIRFVKTHIDREIYHGFEIDEAEVPKKIRELLG